MALAIVPISRATTGAQPIPTAPASAVPQFVTGTLTFDSSYPTGGETLTAADLGFHQRIQFVIFEPSSGRSFEMDYANEKVIARRNTHTENTAGSYTQNATSGATAEEANATNLSRRWTGLSHAGLSRPQPDRV